MEPIQGMKLIFLSDSHWAPKFFKVVANSKKVGRHFYRQKKTFFYAFRVLDRPSKIKFYKVDTRMDNIKHSSSPKSKMAPSFRWRCMFCVLETNLTRKFAADLS